MFITIIIISVLKSVVRKYNFASTKFVDKKFGLDLYFQTGYANLYGKNVFFFLQKFCKDEVYKTLLPDKTIKGV